MPVITENNVASTVTILNGVGVQIGTGFVVGYRSQIDSPQFFYLITCEHCVCQRHSRVRVDTAARFANGSVLSIIAADWSAPPSGDDIVAHDVTDTVRAAGGHIGSVGLDIVGNPPNDFGIGVDLYMLGLDVQQANVNVPRARFGNLSGFADPLIELEQGNGVLRPVHLGDMRSRSGFSGSPVFAYVQASAWGGLSTSTRLLGVHSGQHHEPIEITIGGQVSNGTIPSSMTRIVPAWAVQELLDNDARLMQQRAGRP